MDQILGVSVAKTLESFEERPAQILTNWRQMWFLKYGDNENLVTVSVDRITSETAAQLPQELEALQLLF